jgi:hypothetical protein
MEHHLYVCPASSRELQRHLIFRDALLKSPEIRNEYERIKTEIETAAAGDRRLYAHIKETTCRTFIEGYENFLFRCSCFLPLQEADLKSIRRFRRYAPPPTVIHVTFLRS